MTSVLLNANFSVSTGYAWRHFHRIYNEIGRHARERDVELCLVFGELDAPVSFLDEGIAHHAYEWPFLGHRLRDYARLVRIVRRHQIRYAYLTDQPTWSPLYALLRLCGVRKIAVHSHASVPDPRPAPRQRGIKRVLKRLLHRWPFGADLVIAASHFVRRALIDRACCPEERVVVLYYGLDLDDGHTARNRSNGPLRIFCAGRATVHKGIDVLIAAAARLRARPAMPPFVIEYAGDGPDLEAFRAYAARLQVHDVFKFLGRRDDVQDIMRRADIVVVPSVWGDACPLTVLEGMAAGAAVVGSTAGGIPEEIGEEGAGVLVPIGDPDALADAVARLCLDSQGRVVMGQRARARVQRLFSTERNHPALIRVLDAAWGWQSARESRTASPA